MYTPKISETLIPILYRLRRVRNIPMTRLVDELILKALATEAIPDTIKEMVDEIAKKKQAA